jgi:hypothetical protein
VKDSENTAGLGQFHNFQIELGRQILKTFFAKKTDMSGIPLIVPFRKIRNQIHPGCFHIHTALRFQKIFDLKDL